jgi:hypothetical protein
MVCISPTQQYLYGDVYALSADDAFSYLEGSLKQKPEVLQKIVCWQKSDLWSSLERTGLPDLPRKTQRVHQKGIEWELHRLERGHHLHFDVRDVLGALDGQRRRWLGL